MSGRKVFEDSLPKHIHVLVNGFIPIQKVRILGNIKKFLIRAKIQSVMKTDLTEHKIASNSYHLSTFLVSLLVFVIYGFICYVTGRHIIYL